VWVANTNRNQPSFAQNPSHRSDGVGETTEGFGELLENYGHRILNNLPVQTIRMVRATGVPNALTDLATEVR
jgi:hypothetical protein